MAGSAHDPLLRFPEELGRLRQSRKLSQKSLALTIDMDPSQLSGLERGSRPPPNPATIADIASALTLDQSELSLLEWCARHDRCVRFILEVAASPREAQLVSQVLRASALLDNAQQEGLSEYLKGLQLAAQRMASLSIRVDELDQPNRRTAMSK
ncbi:XRE family transcriptional regulator [Aquabacterium lacunae]|uniref:XRE family transcriptional regulator n=1 Tax=Aquabacterium lacunae TaxID=2528630 RepID=A0A4Q9GW96_9BURK|nr:helix-turn-helix transcriptional regulator [Aquabacterium lacunae]TBO29301.1 XRE family transcriptional regulator [Aquabacterium lacunae]